MENTLIKTKVTPGSDSEKAGVIGYGAGGNAIYKTSEPTITVDKLKPVDPLVLPKKTIDSTPQQLSGLIASSVDVNKTAKNSLDSMIQENTQKSTSAETELTKTLKDILGTNDEIANVESTVDRTAVNTAQEEANKYTSQIESEQLATRRAIESLQKNNPAGLFGGALQDEVNRLERDSVSKQADLAILQNVALRNYDTASRIADSQVQMKLKPLQTKLENLKFFYDANKSIFDKTQDRLYTAKIKQMDREYDAEETKLKFENDKKLARYKADLDIQVLKQKEGLSGGSSNAELGNKMVGTYAPGTTGYAMGIMLASSPNKKALTDGQITKIEKAKTALLQLQNVNELMKNVKTGPFGGRLNKGLAAIGGAPNSYAVNAALTGLVPTLARGTYGEVGVLTDNDINLYKKTIPNLTSTSAQNALVQASTLKVIQGGLRSQLETLARGGYDVSLFAEDYNNFSKQILNIEDTIVDKNGNSVNAIRVSDTIKSAPNLKPLVEQMLADGKSYSDVLIALGRY